MKGWALLAIMALLSASSAPAFAAEADPDGPGWRLISEDRRGNLLYVHPATMEQPAEGIVRVWMKYVSRAGNSPSPMLFLSEVDCSEGLIRRLEVRLHRSTGAGSGEPFRSFSFQGRWDRLSEGIEESLKEAVCREGGIGSL